MKRALVFCLLSAMTSAAQAAFIGGVESFNGTTIDTATWSQSTGPGSISQNNALFMSRAATGSSVLTTDPMFGIAVGGSANVQFTITAPTTSGDVGFQNGQQVCLELGTATSPFIRSSSYVLDCDLFYHDAGSGSPLIGFSSSGGGAGFGVTGIALNQTFSLWIERTSSTLADYYLLDSTSHVMKSVTLTVPSFTTPLRLSLAAINMDVTFDNVQVTGLAPVPEPAAMAILLPAAALLLRRR